MDFENWITGISDTLPNFTVRIVLLSFILLWISLATILFFIGRKKKKLKILKRFLKIQYLVFGSLFLLLTVGIYFYYSTYLEKFFGPNKTYFILLTGILSIFLFLKQILILLKRKKILKIFYILEVTLLTLLFISLLTISLFTVPHVSVTTGNNSKFLETTGKVKLNFTSPLKNSDIKITISPENNFTLGYEYFLGIKGLISSITVTPMESFLPSQKVVVYTTGIQRIFPWGTKHENSQDFFTPRSPEIEEVVLGTDTQNVSIEQPIKIDLDINDQQSVEWQAIFTPFAEYKIIRDLDDSVIIQPEKLKQGTSYELEILKSIITYNPLTLEKISTESQEVVRKIAFRTAPAPGIVSFNRSSGILSNTQPLIINFEVPLKESSLENRVQILPEIEGKFSLSEDKKQLIFTPNNGFAKNTEYKVNILSGVENIYGGYIETDLSISFKTPGYVSLIYASPRNGSTNIALETSSVSLTFNQPVDHKSVEERFSISPVVNGTFSWSGNTFYYNFSNKLEYSTKYTVSVAKGVKALYGIDSSSTISTSFTTKHQTFLLNVPLYFQSESFTCNLAATKMVLAYRGRSSSEAGIRDSIGIGLNPNADWVDQYGVHWGPISSYISSRGVSNTIKTGWNLTSALQEVKNGNPVLIYYYNGSTVPKGAFTLEGGYTGYKGMHSSVIVGFIGKPEDPTTVIVNDPWRGKRYLSKSSFLYLWGYINYTGIIIY